MEITVSPDGGSTWHIIPWETDGSWTYDWDTTQGPNGVFALIARSTDLAGNITTDQVNVIVDNAPPTVTLTDSWSIWDTARASVFSNIIPLGSISITVDCNEQPDRVIDYNANNGAFDFKWDRRCGDGNLASSGTYTVVLEACDIYNNCDEARGKVEIPFGALQAVPPTATPMPTIENTEVVQQWYTNPTAMPSTTPTPQAQQTLPVLPVTANGESGDGNIPSGNNQPLLPLAAAALGTSVLLAASSRREEETANAPAAAETTYVEAASLSSIAGVVKEAFTGVWEDAVRISAADPRRVTTTHTGIDMDEYNRKLAGWVIASEQAYKEIAKEKEKKRQEAIQWLADNKARTDEAARVAKEQEKAAAIAAAAAAEFNEKGAKYNAHYTATIAAYQAEQKSTVESRLGRMEEETEDNNLVNPGNNQIVSAPSWLQSSIGFAKDWLFSRPDEMKAAINHGEKTLVDGTKKVNLSITGKLSDSGREVLDLFGRGVNNFGTVFKKVVKNNVLENLPFGLGNIDEISNVIKSGVKGTKSGIKSITDPITDVVISASFNGYDAFIASPELSTGEKWKKFAIGTIVDGSADIVIGAVSAAVVGAAVTALVGAGVIATAPVGVIIGATIAVSAIAGYAFSATGTDVAIKNWVSNLF